MYYCDMWRFYAQLILSCVLIHSYAYHNIVACTFNCLATYNTYSYIMCTNNYATLSYILYVCLIQLATSRIWCWCKLRHNLSGKGNHRTIKWTTGLNIHMHGWSIMEWYYYMFLDFYMLMHDHRTAPAQFYLITQQEIHYLQSRIPFSLIFLYTTQISYQFSRSSFQFILPPTQELKLQAMHINVSNHWHKIICT